MMIRATIDGRSVEVPTGTTILAAATAAGIRIPSLCCRDGCRPEASCRVCLVRIQGRASPVPACATALEDGMAIESSTEEVRALRRAAVDLLLSEHRGDCVAPCERACPAHLEIPEMLRYEARGDRAGAAAVARRRIVLAATLGHVCPAPCEKVCRRAAADGAVAICRLKRFAGQCGGWRVEGAGVGEQGGKWQAEGGRLGVDGLNPPPSTVPLPPGAAGRRVAVVGAGPAGLGAAWALARAGIAVTVFERAAAAGGALRTAIPEARLPRAVLDAEIVLVADAGVRFEYGQGLDGAAAWASVRAAFDALIVATGPAGSSAGGPEGLRSGTHGIEVDAHTGATSLPGVFAAGAAVHAMRMGVSALASGTAAAAAALAWLETGAARRPARPFGTQYGTFAADEAARFLARGAVGAAAAGGPDGPDFTAAEAQAQAARCLSCDCARSDDCRLRAIAVELEAKPAVFTGVRRAYDRDTSHPAIDYEPAKCIGCGLCVQVACAAGEPVGVSVAGRGFGVRMTPAFDRPMAEALTHSAAACVAACPTGALAAKREPKRPAHPPSARNA